MLGLFGKGWGRSVVFLFFQWFVLQTSASGIIPSDLVILASIKIKHFVLEYEVMIMFMNTEYSIHTYM